ncbi:hypothetical protein C2U68_09915 [Methylomonas koyamae]|nr:hypothetical protein C2U68_09915 [Methylomonas koyamae]
MQVSTSAYYAWLKAPQDNDNQRQDQKLAEKVRQLFIDNKQSFGSRRLADRLQKQGFAVGRFKTRRIMRDLKLTVRYPNALKSPRTATTARPYPPIDWIANSRSLSQIKCGPQILPMSGRCRAGCMSRW